MNHQSRGRAVILDNLVAFTTRIWIIIMTAFPGTLRNLLLALAYVLSTAGFMGTAHGKGKLLSPGLVAA